MTSSPRFRSAGAADAAFDAADRYDSEQGLGAPEVLSTAIALVFLWPILALCDFVVRLGGARFGFAGISRPIAPSSPGAAAGTRAAQNA